MNTPFLSFLILTYRRPNKLKRLLHLFQSQEFAPSHIAEMEIVIVDDHSEDNTLECISHTLELLTKAGWAIRYIYRSKNLRGDKNLYEGYTSDAKGEYIWFFCDDDIFFPKKAIEFIKQLRQSKPIVGICGFQQGLNNEISNRLGTEIKLVQEFEEVIYWLSIFPKTSAYAYRRSTFDLSRLIQRWDNTLYSWVGIGIYLQFRSGLPILLFPEITAEADTEYLNLQYSYRTFRHLAFVVEDCCKLLKMPFSSVQQRSPHLLYNDEMTLCLQGLSAHYSYTSPVKYNDDILTTELAFFRSNYLKSLVKQSRFVYLIKLIIYYLIDLIKKRLLYQDILRR